MQKKTYAFQTTYSGFIKIIALPFLFTFIDGLWRKMIYVYLLKDIKELFFMTLTLLVTKETQMD